ncbi:MAG: hypothetical protein H0Z39_10500 [Peptococcaceae bacterium]|nr:hypothetical protein [Peptococcaceae bacterium]
MDKKGAATGKRFLNVLAIICLLIGLLVALSVIYDCVTAYKVLIKSPDLQTTHLGMQ